MKQNITFSAGVDVPEFVHICRYYVGPSLSFIVNIGSFGAVTGAAIVYLILIVNFELSIGNFFYCEFNISII